jgi:hypothetical protein
LASFQREPAKDGQVGVKPDALNAPHAEHRQPIVVLQPAELALNGGAAAVQVTEFLGVPRDMRVGARRVALDRQRDLDGASALDRLTGCSSSVLTITRSTSSSLIDRGFPGRGSSCNPSKPRRANRPRHLPTVEPVQPNSAAISVLERPSAAASTIRHRNANACELFGRRAHRSSTSRSPSPSTTSTTRPAMTASNRRRRGRRSRPTTGSLRTNDSGH